MSPSIFGPLRASLALLLSLAPLNAHAADAAPPLVIVISVDQFSSTLFNQWRSDYRGGLARLSSGIVYANGYQSHAFTETCPGHSTLLSGRHPSGTGIVANDWYDATLGRMVYCVEAPDEVLAHDGSTGRNTDRLMVDTLGDWLKARSPKSRVVSISGKDRSALMMGGHHADSVFWFVDGYGFSTSMKKNEDAATKLAPLGNFNTQRVVPLKQKLPDWTYEHTACKSLEASYRFGEQDWHAQLPPAHWRQLDASKRFADELRASPYLDELTLAAAQQLITHYQLGRGTQTDLLTISLSATDGIGHRYGSQGPEMCDQIHRLDTMLGRFFAQLDASGQRYVVALSADHGGLDFPERLQQQGQTQAQRFALGTLFGELNTALQKQFELDFKPLRGDADNPGIVDAQGHALAEPLRTRVQQVLLERLKAVPEVELALSREDALKLNPISPSIPADELSIAQRLAESAYDQRSGDVLIALKPGVFASSAKPGKSVSGHGTPWDYDRRVPLVFWWKGAPKQERFMAAETVDIGPSLAGLIGLPVPDGLDGRDLQLSR